MSTLRILPLRRTLAASILVTAGSLVMTTWLVGRAFQRHPSEIAGPMAAALQLASVQESNRVRDALAARMDELDTTLASLLAESPTSPPAGAPFAATHKLCDGIPLPPAVTRMGVMGVESNLPLAWLERGEKGCLDRLWSMQVQALTGPPYPAPEDVARLAQSGLLGMDHAAEGKLQLVGVYREGVVARLRFARAQEGRVAFADVDLSELPEPPVVPLVRQDSFVTVDGVVAGYIHGGPGVGMVPAAVKRIKAHEDRALMLPEVVEASASRAVMAWLNPSLWDPGELALAGHAVTLESPVPLAVKLVTVSSTPWPAAGWYTRLQLLLLWVLAAALHAALLVVFNRRLAGALWRNAQAVRAAWMVSHEDVELPDENKRAVALLDAMEKGTQDNLHAAFGVRETFWSKGGLARLLAILREKLNRP